MFDFAMQGRPLSARVLEILGCVARRRHDAAMPVAEGKQQRGRVRKNLSWANRAGTLIGRRFPAGWAPGSRLQSDHNFRAAHRQLVFQQPCARRL